LGLGGARNWREPQLERHGESDEPGPLRVTGSRSNMDDRGTGGVGRYESENTRNGRGGHLPPGADSVRQIEYKRSVSLGSTSGVDDETARGEL